MEPAIAPDIVTVTVSYGDSALVPIYDADDYRRRFPDGRIGADPTLATVEIGRKLYEGAVEEIGGMYEAFLAED